MPSVQRGTEKVAFPAASADGLQETSKPITITSVDPAKSVLHLNYCVSKGEGRDIPAVYVAGKLTNATTVDVVLSTDRKKSSRALEVTIEWQVIDHT